MTAAVRDPQQTLLKRLAGALAVLCLALLILAVDQRLAADAWRTTRDAVSPVAIRLWDWARGLAEDRSAPLSDLGEAWRGEDAEPALADPGPALLVGDYRPADEATRAATGGVAFVGAAIRFDRGETLRTTPLRIAAGRDAFAPGQTFAARLAASPDAQIELRRIVPLDGKLAVGVSPLCQNAAPATLALLHRDRRVDLILFRQGPLDGPVSQVCGVWSYRR